MRVAIVVSAHGFGHLARQLAVGEALRARGATPVYYTAAPPEVVRADQPDAEVVPWRVDVGLVQRDSLTEDVPGTLQEVAARCAEDRIDALAAELRGVDRVIVDVAPAGLEAARRAGHRPWAVGNFDWAWIYRHYAPLTDWAERFARWQAPHHALELWPGPGMRGFASVEACGLVARRGAAGGATGPVRVTGRSVLVSFGGFGLDGLDALLPRIDGVTWVLAPPMRPLDRPDCAWAPGVPFPALVAGADAVLTKPGYGIFGEAAVAGTRVAWLDRGAFPEAPFLEAALAERGDVKAERADRAAVELAVRTVLAQPRRTPVAADGAAYVASRVLGSE